MLVLVTTGVGKGLSEGSLNESDIEKVKRSRRIRAMSRSEKLETAYGIFVERFIVTSIK